MAIIVENNVEFHIDENGVLYRMKNILDPINAIDAIGINVKIPSSFSNGVRINALGENFCDGCYNEVIVSSEIKEVHDGAFRWANVASVYWPEACTKIPAGCFKNSTVTKLLGIEKVTQIDNEAFSNTRMREFTWPTNCEVIPKSCFAGSGTKSIYGTENVKVIEDLAFYNSWITDITSIQNVKSIGVQAFRCSQVRNIEWPTGCKEIPRGCFYMSELETISNLQNVEAIGEYAFYEAKHLRNLDLSNSMILSIGGRAFSGVDKGTNIFPYYADELALQ